ncbi:hypothetical protein [Clostridium sp.]|jgi:hypothetical protein|uniref:hypothetical protein n=1 Tax=Clostridium sp. TaxID=1506 RepID=UPI003A5BA7FF
MKCEKFAQITDLKDFLENNLIIAHLCGFNILKLLPSYRTFQRFIKNIQRKIIQSLIKTVNLEYTLLITPKTLKSITTLINQVKNMNFTGVIKITLSVMQYLDSL